MMSLNFIGIPIFILFAAALVLIIIGIFTRRPRLWKPALWILAAASLAYLLLFAIFR